MTATNHAAVGALVAVAIKEPVLALPLAFVSHFALDALPHFGYEGKDLGHFFRQPLTRFAVAYEIVGLIALTIILFNASWLVIACALIAVSPDFIWIYRFIFQEKMGKLESKRKNFFSSFHSKIQWCEKPWGLFVELALTPILLYVLAESLK